MIVNKETISILFFKFQNACFLNVLAFLQRIKFHILEAKIFF